MTETKDGARQRQELRRSNAAVPIPSRKQRRERDKLRRYMTTCDYCGRPIGFYGCPTHGVDCYEDTDDEIYTG